MILSPTSLRPLIRFNNPLKNALKLMLQGVFVVSKKQNKREMPFCYGIRFVYFIILSSILFRMFIRLGLSFFISEMMRPVKVY